VTTDERREIARLCENLPWLRGAADAAGLRARLDSAVAAAASGRADGITELLRRMDVPEAPTLRDPGGIMYPPTTENRYGIEEYECPAGACDRTWIRPPGVPVPPCAVRGTRLRQRSSA
jgi:hypothetical protein